MLASQPQLSWGGCRAGALQPAWELPSKTRKGSRFCPRPAAASCTGISLTPLHRARSSRELGSKPGLCDGLFSFFCSLEEGAPVSPALG